MDYRIAVITSLFNESVITELQKGALETLSELGYGDQTLSSIEVPGAYEIPLAAKWCLDKGYDGILCLGAVIRGETTHYDYVCNAVERGCSQLQLEYSKPVVFGILTTENKDQAWDRLGGTKGHKGKECAMALQKMLLLKKQLQKL